MGHCSSYLTKLHVFQITAHLPTMNLRTPTPTQSLSGTSQALSLPSKRSPLTRCPQVWQPCNNTILRFHLDASICLEGNDKDIHFLQQPIRLGLVGRLFWRLKVFILVSSTEPWLLCVCMDQGRQYHHHACLDLLSLLLSGKSEMWTCQNCVTDHAWFRLQRNAWRTFSSCWR